MREKKFLIKLKNAQIIFSLIEVIIFASFAQKIFFKILFEEDVIKFQSIRSDLDQSRKKEKNNDMRVNLSKQRLSLRVLLKSSN
jgi:hypothetical protein